MKDVKHAGAALAFVLIVSGDVPALAQRVLSDSVSPFGTAELSDADRSATKIPNIVGSVTPEDEASFEKYYVFNRANTDLAVAYADIKECDGYASGLSTGYKYQDAPYPYTYTVTGAVGGAIGNLMVAAIFGSAEKRRMRRINMRTCMSYKGYQRYGLSKSLWEKFNFEEGLDGVSAEVRKTLLLQQAMVASGPVPAGKALGL